MGWLIKLGVSSMKRFARLQMEKKGTSFWGEDTTSMTKTSIELLIKQKLFLELN